MKRKPKYSGLQRVSRKARIGSLKTERTVQRRRGRLRFSFKCHPHKNPEKLIADHKRWGKWKAKRKRSHESRRVNR